MPRLINVLRGEMSVVGPRPEDPRHVAHYSTEQRGVLAMRAGMARLALIRYRREEDLLACAGNDAERVNLTPIMPDRLPPDLEYVEQPSFLGDLATLERAASRFAEATAAPQTWSAEPMDSLVSQLPPAPWAALFHREPTCSRPP
jgi:lipopolysaccharide/colanic/teichoic acid biosynthesis glycosyltransferase